MFNMLKKRIKNEKGLSLVELLAVIVILGIVAAIAIPAIGNIIQNSRDKAILSESLNILSGAKIAYMEGDCPDGECAQTVLEKYVDGISEGATYSAKFETNVWTVEFSKFSDIKGEKYQLTEKSEQEIKSKIDGEATPAPTPTPPAGG